MVEMNFTVNTNWAGTINFRLNPHYLYLAQAELEPPTVYQEIDEQFAILAKAECKNVFPTASASAYCLKW